MPSQNAMQDLYSSSERKGSLGARDSLPFEGRIRLIRKASYSFLKRSKTSVLMATISRSPGVLSPGRVRNNESCKHEVSICNTTLTDNTKEQLKSLHSKCQSYLTKSTLREKGLCILVCGAWACLYACWHGVLVLASFSIMVCGGMDISDHVASWSVVGCMLLHLGWTLWVLLRPCWRRLWLTGPSVASLFCLGPPVWDEFAHLQACEVKLDLLLCGDSV
ncbi:hypothetical protein STEG23_032738 [Scotinomys teguina]